MEKSKLSEEATERRHEAERFQKQQADQRN